MKSLLEVRGLSVEYGAVRALSDASLEVGQGEIVALIGPNGAGKSTALRAIAGILPHYDGRIAAGDVQFDGKAINNRPPHQLIRLGLSLVPENRHVFPSMTVLENLEMGAYTGVGESRSPGVRESGSQGVGELRSSGGGKRQRLAAKLEEIFQLFPRLKERRGQRAGTLSTGEQQMLAMGRGLMVSPKMLLVDEPTVGLSPNFVDVVFDTLAAINKAGTSILVVEQNARMAIDACHRAYVFEIGKIAFSGPRAELVADDRVRRTYLGLGRQ